MNNYAKSKDILDSIRRRNDGLFHAAVEHLMDVGARFLTKERVEATCESIMKKDNTNDFMTNEFKCNILRVAYDLAQIPSHDLLVYLQREVDYGNFDDSIPYKRAIELLKNCAVSVVMQCDTDAEALDALGNLEFEEEDLKAVGLDYLLEDEDV